MNDVKQISYFELLRLIKEGRQPKQLSYNLIRFYFRDDVDGYFTEYGKSLRMAIAENLTDTELVEKRDIFYEEQE